MKQGGKIAILAFIVAVLAVWGLVGSNLLSPPAKQKPSLTPDKINLPSVSVDTSTPDGASPTASGTTAVAPIAADMAAGCADKPEVRMLVWAWNAQMGLMYATGGPQSARGSLMCKHGVNLKLIRQDDSGKMQEALVAFATELSKGTANPKGGDHFVAIMGDGSAAFLKGLNDTLSKLGPDYRAKVVGCIGYSRGEDKFMGPVQWKDNPASSRGGVVAGVLRDGDWNIAQKWLGDNGLPTNPNEKTWDPDALNWVGASDYIDAAQKYVAGYSEERPIVHNGKPTGQKKKITVMGVVTWTPGDVIVAQKRGGLVSIVSTKEYSSQMPCVIIGIDKWMKANRPAVDGMLQAMLEGGAAVRANADALNKAGQVANAIYKEQGTDPAYWVKYYHGTQEKDKTGTMVDLGGSSVNNVHDALLCFGLVPNSANLFGATYEVFGDLVAQQYPELVPKIYPVKDILDTSYMEDVAKKSSQVAVAPAAPPTLPAATATTASTPVPHNHPPVKKIKRILSRKAWHITFQSGSANFNPESLKSLQSLRRDLLVASGTSVEIHGHTDNVGSADSNMALSESRAFAVKNWLEKSSPVNFPNGRIQVFAEGQTHPVAPNATEQGRAANRRVEIILGTN